MINKEEIMVKKVSDWNVAEDFQFWENEHSAFIKQDVCDGKKLWLIYDAEGERIAATDSREFAFVVARQNDLEPCSVH